MTEKRFYLNEGEVGILKILDLKEDNEAIYHTTSKSDMKMVVELLNELHEENQVLQRRCGAMQEEIEILSEENEQLKQQIKDLRIGVLDSIHEADEIKCSCNPCVVEECVKRVVE